MDELSPRSAGPAGHGGPAACGTAGDADQALARRPDRAPRLAIEPASRLMRLLLFGGSAVITALLGREMFMVLSGGETGLITYVMVALFVVNIGWITLGTCSTVLGLLFAPGITRRTELPEQPARSRPPSGRPCWCRSTTRTPPSVVGAARATLRQLDRAGCAEPFDIFLLSDTTRPDTWLAEQSARRRLRAPSR